MEFDPFRDLATRNVVTIGEFVPSGFFKFFCAVNRTQPTDWFTAFTQLFYNKQIFIENQCQNLEIKCRQSPSEEFEKQTKMKIMGNLSH